MYPSAPASNVRHLPDEDSMPARPNFLCMSIVNMSDTPTVKAPLDWFFLVKSRDKFTATRDDEHAVSIDIAGPRRFSKNDARPTGTDDSTPIPVYAFSL